MASEISRIPVINGGDGAGHHPTQTLLDLYTIKKESHLDNLDIALLGDLKYGRTAHSLVYALDMFGANIALVAPEGLQMPKHIINNLNSVRLAEDVDDVIRDVDVLYVTRIQKERFPDPNEYLRVAKSYRLTLSVLDQVRENLIIMHPLPRIDEIAPEVDQYQICKILQTGVLWDTCQNGITCDSYEQRNMTLKKNKEELRVRSIKNGSVIDHITAGNALNVLKILDIIGTTKAIVSVAMNVTSKRLPYGRKDIVKIEDRELVPAEVDKIALIAPQATINIIRDYEVVQKKSVVLPNVITHVVRCPNLNCISNSAEPVFSKFKVLDSLALRCSYCETIIDTDIAAYLI